MFRAVFNSVTFSNEDGDVASVVNDAGDFTVNLPKSNVDESTLVSFFTGLNQTSEIASKLKGPVGPAGPTGPSGDSIWSLAGNSVTNNGPLEIKIPKIWFLEIVLLQVTIKIN